MNQPKFPISDQDMQVLLQKYSFLRYKDMNTYKQCMQGKSANCKYNWYKQYDGTAYEDLWKNRFMPRLFAEYDKLSKYSKKHFLFIDTKLKYGSLCVYTSFGKTDTVLEDVLEYVSSYVCEECGAEPRTETGKRVILTTDGYIRNLCKDCAEKFLIEHGCSAIDRIKMLNAMKHEEDGLVSLQFVDNKCYELTFKETTDGWLEVDNRKLVEDYTK